MLYGLVVSEELLLLDLYLFEFLLTLDAMLD